MATRKCSVITAKQVTSLQGRLGINCDRRAKAVQSVVAPKAVLRGVLVALDAIWTNFDRKWVVQRPFYPVSEAETLISRGTSAPLQTV